MARPRRQHYVYALVSAEEHARIKALAASRHETISQWIRGCIDDRFADADLPLLVERVWGSVPGTPYRGSRRVGD